MELDKALDFARPKVNGVLTTIKRDGRPQLSNISFKVGDDDIIRISITEGGAKTATLRRDPRASLHVPPDDFSAYAVIEARAELGPAAADPHDEAVEELIALYRSIAGEHPDSDEYRAVMVSDGRVVLKLHPERAYGTA